MIGEELTAIEIKKEIQFQKELKRILENVLEKEKNKDR